MNRIIIACRTLERELLNVMRDSDCHVPVIWLQAGGHNIPHNRRASLEAALDQCKGYDTVLLAMTFCGNALVGLNSKTHTIVVPRFDDCIPLLLGNRKRESDSYYLSAGWLSGKDNLLTEYERSLDKYGKNRADRIFSSMLRHYRQLVWVTDDNALPVPDSIKHFTAQFGLSLVTEKNDPSLLKKLISGDWNEAFLIVPPQTEITLEMRNGGIDHA